MDKKKWKRPTTVTEVRERLRELGDDSSRLVYTVFISLGVMIVFAILAMLTSRSGGIAHFVFKTCEIIALIVWAISGLLLILSRGRYWVEATVGFFRAKDRPTPPPKEVEIPKKARSKYTVIDLIGLNKGGESDADIEQKARALRPDLFPDNDEEEW